MLNTINKCHEVHVSTLCTRAHMSRVVRRPDFLHMRKQRRRSASRLQLRGSREADQRLCFRYIDSTILLLPKSKISSLYPYSVIAQPGLCRTWSETVFSQQGSHSNSNEKNIISQKRKNNLTTEVKTKTLHPLSYFADDNDSLGFQ